MRLEIFTVDAFSSGPFSGNPAAVVLLPAAGILSDMMLQQIAAEMNLSETAFIEPVFEEASDAEQPFVNCQRFLLRWFTPTLEVPLCGHATLASAAVLFQAKRNIHSQVQFDTLSGVLTVRVDKQVPRGLVLSLPLADPTDPVPKECQSPAFVAACVGDLEVVQSAFTAFNGMNYALLALHPDVTRQQLEAIQPDFQAMAAAAPPSTVTGVIVTALGNVDGQDSPYILSRFFAPWAGITEDPVTGSAHAVLGPFWAKKVGSSRLSARQCSARGGELQVVVQPEEQRVLVTGVATIVVEGTLLLPD